MEKLNLIIEDELSILEKYHLTVEEWFFTKLLFLASAEENNPLPLMKYVQLYSPDLRKLLQSLQNKGIILTKRLINGILITLRNLGFAIKARLIF